MRHLTKTNFGQCNCLWCGRRAGDPECPATLPMREAIRDWAAKHGTRWKSKLTDAWTRGDDLGPELQQVRNVIGPSGLKRINSRMLETLEKQV